MDQPIDLSVVEIRNYMLRNDGKVTNHALVKHFKKFLTNSHTQNEARKRFKTYVTLLSTIKNENNQKFLILRKKYINECPSVEAIEAAISTVEPCSPGDSSLISEFSPCRPPPEQTSAKETVHQDQNENYRDCVNKFSESMQRNGFQPCIDYVDSSKNNSVFSRNPLDEAITAENISRFSFSSEASSDSSATDKVSGAELGADESENPISVKEATRKFNRMASEEEARIISPSAKKKQEKQLIEEKDSTEVTMAHPKAKEWIVSMAKANYQELAKLAGEFPELVKLQYTALHWAAKHGNEDVVKLIAGTFKADVNSKTNGGYTPLHLATQFGRDNIFELLWNVYKANRDIMDWNGNKPLDYSQQRPSISASTCSKIQAMRLSGGLSGTWRQKSRHEKSIPSKKIWDSCGLVR
ncbi:ankyrin repeat domain-containing protein SOWAHC isoform X2 [Drosophila willistoni]|uniref:ankyrin repeat domain-containing protein SOWAHC isoform X2 n=1 Tax=Drosophila willistoni TaxID=7260 RepID=UPI001F077BF8|nr:ankyrin repeat domain-containing protein SOWAHC isoform X2 [Drosophila willistoni]